jgi:hypothetical protein
MRQRPRQVDLGDCPKQGVEAGARDVVVDLHQRPLGQRDHLGVVVPADIGQVQ